MPYPRINIRALQALVAVYEEQSFSRAADREHTTQSGMSTQVKNLEDQLGTPLLIRERRKIGLTPAGEVVYREGQSILKALRATERTVLEMHHEVQGNIRFGMIPSLTRAVLPRVVDRYRHRFPGVQLALTEEYSFALLRRVLDGDLEFALVPAGDIPPGLTARFAGRDREVLVSRPGLLAGYTHGIPLPFAALDGVKLIMPTAENVRRRRLDEAMQAQGIRLADLVEMDGMLATLEMVAETGWMAILPSALCFPDRDGTVRQLNPLADPPIALDYVIVEKTDAALSQAARHLTEAIQAEIGAVLTAAPDGVTIA